MKTGGRELVVASRRSLKSISWKWRSTFQCCWETKKDQDRGQTWGLVICPWTHGTDGSPGDWWELRADCRRVKWSRDHERRLQGAKKWGCHYRARRIQEGVLCVCGSLVWNQSLRAERGAELLSSRWWIFSWRNLSFILKGNEDPSEMHRVSIPLSRNEASRREGRREEARSLAWWRWGTEERTPHESHWHFPLKST